jgi:hypothetical protein
MSLWVCQSNHISDLELGAFSGNFSAIGTCSKTATPAPHSSNPGMTVQGLCLSTWHGSFSRTGMEKI